MLDLCMMRRRSAQTCFTNNRTQVKIRCCIACTAPNLHSMANSDAEEIFDFDDPGDEVLQERALEDAQLSKPGPLSQAIMALQCLPGDFPWHSSHSSVSTVMAVPCSKAYITAAPAMDGGSSMHGSLTTTMVTAATVDDAIFVPGDLIGHGIPVDVSEIGHDTHKEIEERYGKLLYVHRDVTALFQIHFPDTLVLPAFGNNDTKFHY